jgi:hypothetical protein
MEGNFSIIFAQFDAKLEIDKAQNRHPRSVSDSLGIKP